MKRVRFRSLGCYPLTAAIESDADNIELILLELLNSRESERQGRTIDKDISASMEKKKQEGQRVREHGEKRDSRGIVTTLIGCFYKKKISFGGVHASY